MFSGTLDIHFYSDLGLWARGFIKMNIEQPNHFVERLAERAEHGETPPYDKIERIGRIVDIGEEFHVRTYLCIYVCKRISEHSVVIVTILYNVANKSHTTRQCRKAMGRRRRLGRMDRWSKEEED